jgi:hypothetical protein
LTLQTQIEGSALVKNFKLEITDGIAPNKIGIAVIFVILSLCRGAQALTVQECSVKYKAAKATNTLNGMAWNDFRKSQCGSEAQALPNGAPAPRSAVPASPSNRAKPGETAAAASTDAVFPSAVSPKYSSESPGKARMHTCLDQYNMNKTTHANGGLNWIMKGGGYYSQCNKHLK